MKKFLDKLKKLFSPFGSDLVKIFNFIHSRPMLEFFVFTTILYFTVDTLCRRSIGEALAFAFDSPFIFFFNYLIIAFTMSLALVFYHRYFFYMVNVSFWLTVSIANYVIQSMRTNPLSAIDFSVVLTAFDIIPRYIGWGGVILVLAAFAVAGVLLVILWRRCPKPVRFNRGRSAIFAGCVCVLLTSFVCGTMYTGYIPAELESAVKAYDDYGFPYCFCRSFVHRGVVSPDEYSEEKMAELMDKLGEHKTGNTADNSPNVIYLQLESFFDVNKVIDLELTENPIPTFTSLKKTCPTGKFSVNAIGGGTANTEFEVLCGMNLAHFGLLECPYSTILNDTTCQSMASVMSNVGYSSHAIHNHIATFYSRHLVYQNLGFNTFTPREYMKNYETNILGWAKDAVLLEEIDNALKSTDGKDFIFTVSVQPHGKYPNYETATEDDIKLISFPNENKYFQVEYYVNQLRESDAVIKELIDYLEDYPEDVVLVVYGDHLPTIGLEAENMFDGDVYSTEYVIWSNCDFKCEGGDIQAYELSAKVLNALGITGGEMFRIHNTLANDEEYYEYMQLMEYDMLKGENYALGDNKPLPTALKLGTQEITLSSLKSYDDVMFVTGVNFTKDSFIFVNDRRLDTVYMSDTMLLAKDVELMPGDEITVAQLCESSTLLSVTAPIFYNPEDVSVTDIPDIFETDIPDITEETDNVPATEEIDVVETEPETETTTD